ncbi:MAG: hypothetical protein QOK43_311 [Acidimicrobiaceae bacterium]|nr:hypothetical protein [Acidimicrobiaceae bacterium]
MAALAALGIGGLSHTASAVLSAGCRSTDTWPGPVGPVGPVAGVGPVGPVANPVPQPHPGHGAAIFVVDGATEPAGCVYTPASPQQTYAVAVPGAWRIVALAPSHAERVVASGGPSTDPNRSVTGTFTVLPGERVALEAYSICTGQAVPTVTIPGTGKGIEGGDTCENTGIMYAAG